MKYLLALLVLTFGAAVLGYKFGLWVLPITLWAIIYGALMAGAEHDLIIKKMIQ